MTRRHGATDGMLSAEPMIYVVLTTESVSSWKSREVVVVFGSLDETIAMRFAEHERDRLSKVYSVYQKQSGNGDPHLPPLEVEVIACDPLPLWRCYWWLKTAPVPFRWNCQRWHRDQPDGWTTENALP